MKTNRSDYIDAEAVERLEMRFVPIKSDDQRDMQSFESARRNQGTAICGSISGTLSLFV
jgi:hypothetical protein